MEGDCFIAKNSALYVCLFGDIFQKAPISILRISGNLFLEENSRILFFNEAYLAENRTLILAVKGEILFRGNSYAPVSQAFDFPKGGTVVVFCGEKETWVGGEAVFIGKKNVYCNTCLWRFFCDVDHFSAIYFGGVSGVHLPPGYRSQNKNRHAWDNPLISREELWKL